MGMTDRLGLRLLTLGALSALGCSSGADVLLGRAPLAEEDEVDGSLGDAGAPEAQVPEVEPRTCDADLAGRPAVELSVQIREAACTGPCSPQLNALRIADDGSAWVASSMGSDRERILIGHYDAAGNQLGSATVANHGPVPLLALDDSGQAWLLAGFHSESFSQLHRFDASVHELQMQTLEGSHMDLIRYPGHGVLLSSRPRPLTALDYDGEELWTSAAGGLGGGRLAIADDGRIVLGSAIRGRDPQLDLDWLNDDGDVLLPTSNTSIAVDGAWSLNLAFSADGELTIVSTVLRASETTGEFRNAGRVTRMDAAGSTKWAWTVDPSLDLASTVDPATGTTLVAGPDSTIVAISPDGTSCRRFAFDGPDLLVQLAVGPGGEIWFGGLDFGEDIVSSFGRVERPDLKW